MESLKRRIRDKITNLQSDAETVKARLKDEELIQTNLERCEEKLSTKLEESFTKLYEMLEHCKQELTDKVDALFFRQRRAITKQNAALQECLASVNKVCADAEELLGENDRSNFLTAHSKVTNRLEECFVELLMLDESDVCNLTLAGVESLEKKIELIHFEEYLPPLDTGMMTVEVKDNDSEQHFKLPVLPVSSQLPVLPVSSQLPTLPVSSQLPTLPVSSQLPVLPGSSQLSTSPVSSQLPTLPVSSQLPVLPVSSQLPVLPGSSQLPTSPVSSQLPVLPSSSQLPTSPVSSQLPVLPVSSQLPMLPVSSQLLTLPVSSQLPTLPVSSQLPMLPVSSLLIPNNTIITSVFSFDTPSNSVHLPFIFTSPPSSVSSGTNLQQQSFSSCLNSTTSLVFSPLVTPSTSNDITQSWAVTSMTFQCPNTTQTVLDVSSVTMVTSVSQSAPMTKISSTVAKGSALKVTTTVSGGSNSLTEHSNTVTTALTVKRPKTIAPTLSVSAVSLLSSHLKIEYLSTFKQGNEIECVVTEVVSPSDFWIQPANFELIRLMNNLECHYTQLEKKGNHGGIEELPKVGEFYCARYSRDCKWYRARILSVNVCGVLQRIEVLYVDYGNQEEVSLSSLRRLDSRFTYLPCQAIKCSLKVRPFIELSSPQFKESGIPQWPKHTKKWFRSLLMGKHAVATFLSANTSNHAQVDIAISREMFLPSLSCLHGVLSITEGIQQFLQSAHFFALFGVSSFMCIVKLAVFNDNKWLTNNLFYGPSLFTFPTPSTVFMHPFSSISPQHSLFPIVKYCDPPSLSSPVSPGFIRPIISPISSLDLSVKTGSESRCHSEQHTVTQRYVLKKRTASLSGLDELTDLPNLQSCGEKVSKLSTPDESAICGAFDMHTVLSTSPNDSSIPSVIDVTTGDQECLSPSTPLLHASMPSSHASTQSLNVSTPSSHASTSSLNVSTPSSHASTPSLNVSTSSLHVSTPSLHVSTSSLHVSTPSLQLSTPSSHVSTPSLHVSTSSLHVSTPSLQLSTPSSHVSTPSLHVSTPSLHVSTPGLHASTPSLHASTPSLHASTPSLHVSTPSSHVSTPSSHVSTPSSHVSTPNLHASTPSSHVSTPSSHVSVPSLHVSTPSSHVSTPSSHVSTPSSHVLTPSSCASTSTDAPNAVSNSVTTTTPISALTQSINSILSSPLSENVSLCSTSSSDSYYEVVNSPLSSSAIAIASKSPECSENFHKVATSNDIKFHTIAALPILSSVIANDSDHYSVIVSHIVSPGEFYLNFASDSEEVRNFDSFQQSLQEHYSSAEPEEDLSENLSVGIICSAKYADGTWNRGIVRHIQSNSNEKKTKYLIQYIDYGNYQWVTIDSIRSLQEEFLSQPALTICCSLSGVVPGQNKKCRRKMMIAAGSENDLLAFDQKSKELFIHDDENVFESAIESKEEKDGPMTEWSQEAKNRFMRLTDGKVLVAIINDEVMMLSWDDVLGVELIDTNAETDVVIADDLVSRGLAQYKTDKSKKDRGSRSSATSISKEHASQPSPTEIDMDAWNPMESHFLSNWNLYQESGRNKGSRTSRGRDRPELQDIMVAKSWKSLMGSLPVENSCVPVVITAVYSPVRFWAQLPLTTTGEEEERNKYEVTFGQLREEMNKQYRQSVFKEREPGMVAHGELVAALSPDDQCWYRAVLKDFDDNTNRVLVAFVDYGDNAWVLETNIRRLHPKFIHLPIQAVECTLDGLKVNEDVDFNWAVQEFLEIIKDKGFAGHIIERHTVSHRVSLELYDTSSSGTSVNLKNILLSKKVVARATTAISSSSSMATVGSYKKNTSSLPG